MVNIFRIQPNGQFNSNSTVHGGPGTCKVLSDYFSLLVVIFYDMTEGFRSIQYFLKYHFSESALLPKQKVFPSVTCSGPSTGWHLQARCVIDECFTDHLYVAFQFMVWHKEMDWRWMCHRKASHILWMNYECRELSIIYNATSTLTPKGQPLVWLGSLQYVLRTWQWHIHM